MKKLFLFLFLFLFMVNFASAITWDNTVYYKLDDDGSNTTVINSINNVDGTSSINTNLLSATGKINKSFDLNGSTDNIDITGVTTGTSSTISMWVYVNSYGGGGVGQKDYLIDIQSGRTIIVMNNVGQLSYYNGGFTDFGSSPSTSAWHLITLTLDNSSNEAKMYVDGIQFGTTKAYTPTAIGGTIRVGSQYLTLSSDNIDAKVDEIGIWPRVLNSTEVSELWNGGVGMTCPISKVNILTNLTHPVNGSIISDTGTNFTAELNITGINKGYIWRNLTYYVWENGTEENSTFINLAALETNNTIYSQFIDDFTFGDYEWNAYACYGNSTFRNCTWVEDSNYTFEVALYSVTNESYVNETIAGTLENFSLSIDLLPGYDLLSADFVYNGYSNSPSILSDEDGRYILISDYQIPIISADVNLSFYWNLTFTGGINSNTDNRTQLVKAVLLDDCSVYTNEIFDISLFDESTREIINGDIEIVYSILNIPNYEVIRTTNYSIDSINNTRVCSELNLTDENLAYSAEIRYSSSGYSSEFYYIQRAVLTGLSQNLKLFLLNESSYTRFKITYQDSTFKFIESAIIQLQRKYIGLDQYETVEAPLTSSDGTAILHIDLNTVKYRATVVKNGEVLDEFDNLVFDCESELTGECEQTLLGEIDPQNDLDYDTTRDFTYTIIPGDNNITITFSIPSGEASLINMQLTQKDSFGNSTLCNETLTSSAGSIQCTYSDSIVDSYLDLKIYKDGVQIGQNTYIISETTSGLDWLNNNFIIVVLLILTLVGMAVTSPEWMVMLSVLGLVISGALWLVNGLDFVVGLGLLGFLFVAAIIIILKLAKQEDR